MGDVLGRTDQTEGNGKPSRQTPRGRRVKTPRENEKTKATEKGGGQTPRGGLTEADFCSCFGSSKFQVNLARAPRKPSLSFEKAFDCDKLYTDIDQEIIALFRAFDRNHDGSISWGKQIDRLIQSLMARGFRFGARIGSPRNSNTRQLVRKQTVYKLVTTRRVRAEIWKTLGEEDAEDGFEVEECREWLEQEICSKRRNILVLLRASTRLDEFYEYLFYQDDLDSSGFVPVAAVQKLLARASPVIGEIVPDDALIADSIRRVLRDKVDDELLFPEYRNVVTEHLATMYYSALDKRMTTGAEM